MLADVCEGGSDLASIADVLRCAEAINDVSADGGGHVFDADRSCDAITCVATESLMTPSQKGRYTLGLALSR